MVDSRSSAMVGLPDAPVSSYQPINLFNNQEY